MDFIILKVNGTDVSSFPHEDAVRFFLTAQEPIVVEVKRRISENSLEKIHSHNDGNKLVSTGCQTDLSGMSWFDENSLDCLTQDLDLEEVTLRKCSSEEKLGLTVCYSSGSEVDTCTEVYIRDIAPQSLADRDGRLRQGDQILQVNGKDVANKDETESLFAENRKAVTLLISRYYNSRSEEYLDGEEISTGNDAADSAYQNSLIEQLIIQQQQQQQQESRHSPAPAPSGSSITSGNDILAPKIPAHSEQLHLTNSLVRSQIESINQEISELDHRMQNIQLISSCNKSDQKRKPPELPIIPAPSPIATTHLESDTEHIYETIPECNEALFEPIYSCPYESAESNIIEHWLNTQEQPCWTTTTITTSASSQNTKELRNKQTKCKSSKSNSSGEEHENSSSAYNTGGSTNSTPLTFELACNQDVKCKDQYRSTLILCPPGNELQQQQPACEVCKPGSRKKSTKAASTSKTNSPSSPTTRMVGMTTLNSHFVSDTMYTNVANLQQTMLLQQQLFRQALSQNQNHHQNQNVVDNFIAKPTTSFTVPSLSQYQFSNIKSYHTQPSTVETRMEWKVKRRPDGSRYIARRPVRNRILKNRAIKISEERAGLTTEDDTISELKIGRYWTKEERKRHLEKSREKKQRQEILLASRNISNGVREKLLVEPAHGKKLGNNPNDNTIKKHKSNTTKKFYKEQFHDIIVVAAAAASSSAMASTTPKVPNSSSKMGLLSVTTV